MRTLIIGAAASGKSEYAESRLLGKDKLFYLATLADFGGDSLERIAKHRKNRAGKGFSTIESARSIYALGEETLPHGANLLLECVGNLAANELFMGQRKENEAFESIRRGILLLESRCADIVVVTNDVFGDGAAYDAATTEYMRLLARCNAFLASRFDEVIEVVCGIPIFLKASRG